MLPWRPRWKRRLPGFLKSQGCCLSPQPWLKPGVVCVPRTGTGPKSPSPGSPRAPPDATCSAALGTRSSRDGTEAVRTQAPRCFRRGRAAGQPGDSDAAPHILPCTTAAPKAPAMAQQRERGGVCKVTAPRGTSLPGKATRGSPPEMSHSPPSCPQASPVRVPLLLVPNPRCSAPGQSHGISDSHK